MVIPLKFDNEADFRTFRDEMLADDASSEVSLIGRMHEPFLKWRSLIPKGFTSATRRRFHEENDGLFDGSSCCSPPFPDAFEMERAKQARNTTRDLAGS